RILLDPQKAAHFVIRFCCFVARASVARYKTTKALAFARAFGLSGWQDSNLRPPHPKCGAIPGYATPRKGITFVLCGTNIRHILSPSRAIHEYFANELKA